MDFVAPFSCEFLIEDGVIAGYNRAIYSYNVA